MNTLGKEIMKKLKDGKVLSTMDREDKPSECLKIARKLEEEGIVVIRQKDTFKGYMCYEFKLHATSWDSSI